VLVAGATGVGKSALINETFGCTLAEESAGKPHTMTFERYTLPSKPVTILDTQGFELRSSDPRS
jgi:predicted GTPase